MNDRSTKLIRMEQLVQELKRLRAQNNAIQHEIREVRQELLELVDELGHTYASAAGCSVIEIETFDERIVELLEARGLDDCIKKVPITKQIEKAIRYGVLSEEEVAPYRVRTRRVLLGD